MELKDYVDKCRCCYGSLDTDDSASNISKVIEKRIYFIANIELRSSPLLSKRICKECHNKLATFYYFKQELLSKQEKLNKALDEFTEEFQENDQPADPVTQVDIKTEKEFGIFKISEKFESDFQDSVENFSFEPSLEKEPVKKKRKKKDPFRNSDDEVEKNSCPICQKYFTTKRKISLHVARVHNQIKNHKCDVCKYRACTKFDIVRHIKAHHLPPEPDPKDLRICPDCGKVLKGNNHLNFHIKTKHLKLTKFSCDLCDFKSYGKYEIRSHIEIHHLPLELRKGFPCDLCSSVLTTAMSLKTHKTHKHSGLKPHKCFCGKAYALRETLKSHIRNVHNGERKYKCSHCDKGFNSNPRLRDHINNMHGTRQEIPCEKCGKTFNSIRNLQTHMIYHQPPSLKCNYCEKFFFIKKNLREHQESVHLGITYSCELCTRTFQSTSGLRRHAKSHVK